MGNSFFKYSRFVFFRSKPHGKLRGGKVDKLKIRKKFDIDKWFLDLLKAKKANRTKSGPKKGASTFMSNLPPTIRRKYEQELALMKSGYLSKDFLLLFSKLSDSTLRKATLILKKQIKAKKIKKIIGEAMIKKIQLERKVRKYLVIIKKGQLPIIPSSDLQIFVASQLQRLGKELVATFKKSKYIRKLGNKIFLDKYKALKKELEDGYRAARTRRLI